MERFRIQGTRLAVFRRYLETVLGKIPEDATLLDIIRPLAKFIHSLPEYTQKTPRLAAETLAVRSAFGSAKSPAQLLFTDLPRACHFEAFDIHTTGDEVVENYMQRLVACLRELKSAYTVLMQQFQEQLAQALDLSEIENLTALRERSVKRFAGLEQYCGGERPDMAAFLRRLQTEHSEDRAWLESVATFVGSIPPAKWQENHCQ